MLTKKFIPLYFFTFLLLPGTRAFCSESEKREDDAYFDQNMLIGGASVENLNLLNARADLTPGEYQVDVYLNEKLLSNRTIRFELDATQTHLLPCLDKSELLDAGVMPDAIIKDASCTPDALIPGASSRFTSKQLRLDLYIPQARMNRTARDSVPVSSLDAGSSMLFANYDANYYRNRAAGQTSDSGYLGLNNGFNLGLWQLRQQSNLTYYRSEFQQLTRFKVLNTYLQRPLVGLESQMIVGDAYTSASQFGSLSFRGLQFYSDDRMLSASRRGYAPTIRGIANTNASVVVKQSGNVIYQTSVPPGEFKIDDLYPTSYQGDLDVEVREANGHISSFTVPFSAVPESVRSGQFKYNFSFGRIRNITNSSDIIGDMVGRYGLSNSLTLSGGLRGARGYRAGLLGTVFSNVSGAYGLNAVYSNADVPHKGTQNGWRFSLNYSKTVTPTNTNIALAAFRYSTSGFYDLNDVIGLRRTDSQESNWVSSTYQQRNQFTATVSQPLASYGHLYFSGSASDYRGNRQRDTQYQLGYNFSLYGISYDLSYSRQKTGRTYYGRQNDENTQDAYRGSRENIIVFSLSTPLGGASSSSLSTTYTHQSGSSDKGSQIQSSLGGLLGDDNSLSYGTTVGYSNQSDNNASISGSLQKQFASMTAGVTAAKGENYTQYGASARGAAVVHSGGIIFSPYLGDSFALIEAKGAEGATVQNAMGARVNASGYAIMPSLIPYSFNEVVLDPQGMINNNVELKNQSNRIAPYAGAMVKIHMKTSEGYPLLLSVDGGDLPLALGAEVYDEAGKVIGMVSQGSVIYARVKSLSGAVYVRSEKNRCTLAYSVADKTSNLPLYRASAICKRGQ